MAKFMRTLLLLLWHREEMEAPVMELTCFADNTRMMA